jgi:hypothetical protein
MAEGDTLVNALIGAVVGVIAGSILPFGPLLGGLTAGYLEGGTRSDGLQVGLYAGLIALVPLLLGGFALVSFLGIFAIGVGPDGFAIGAAGLVFLVIAFVGSLVYVVGLSAAGGWLGNYIRYDTDLGS